MMNNKVEKQGENSLFTVLGIMMLLLGGCFAIMNQTNLILVYSFLAGGTVFSTIAIVRGLLLNKRSA